MSTAVKENAIESEQSEEEAATILSRAYNLSERSARFKAAYEGSIGFSAQAKNSDGIRLGINAMVAYKTVESLGFKRLDESMVESTLPDENKINLLLLTSKASPELIGPSYLVMKPFVARMYLMCSKWHLALSLQQREALMRRNRRSFRTGSGKILTHEQFAPFTLNLDNKKLEEALAKKPGRYLAKPTRGSMGYRMQLVNIREKHVKEDLLQFLLSSEFKSMERWQVILQEYVERPLLIDKRKFDMRVYMLVVNARKRKPNSSSIEAGYFVFMHPGFVRLSISPYAAGDTDLAVHLTNQSVQAKKPKAYRQLKEVTTWYPDELNEYCNKRKIGPTSNWPKDVLYPKVGALLGYIAELFNYFLCDGNCETGAFRILGVDLLVDSNFKLYLLEFNECPSWGRQTSVLLNMKPNLWKEAVGLVCEVAIRHKNGQAIKDDTLVTRRNFSLIYSSQNTQLARDNIARFYK